MSGYPCTRTCPFEGRKKSYLVPWSSELVSQSPTPVLPSGLHHGIPPMDSAMYSMKGPVPKKTNAPPVLSSKWRTKSNAAACWRAKVCKDRQAAGVEEACSALEVSQRSNLSSTQKPTFRSQRAFMYIPLPCLFPFCHSPS